MELGPSSVFDTFIVLLTQKWLKPKVGIKIIDVSVTTTLRNKLIN